MAPVRSFENADIKVHRTGIGGSPPLIALRLLPIVPRLGSQGDPLVDRKRTEIFSVIYSSPAQDQPGYQLSLNGRRAPIAGTYRG
jgi:hypothetical protein